MSLYKWSKQSNKLIQFCISSLCLLLVLPLIGCGGTPQVTASVNVVEAVNADNNQDFARVTEPRPFVFPQDHGPHPDYQIEWWYYTGNLATEEGRRFGFQLTFFRSGLTPDPVPRDSAWGTSSVYLAHFALSDITNNQFYSFDRLSRGGAGLAGATGDPFRVFLEDWSATGSGPEGMRMHLQAAEDPVAIDLVLQSTKPPVLQGDQGYSQKGAARDNASYYYSLTRMATTGTIRVAGESYTVQGASWMDHEFSTSLLEDNLVGWDWFSLQFDDGREMMYSYLRTTDGAAAYPFGTLVAPDGSSRSLQPDEVQVVALDTWRSPRSEVVYPSGWRLQMPDEGLTLEIMPLMVDQEMSTSVVYWEGAVRAEGTQNGQVITGYGYVELTGYAESQQGRF